MAYPTRRTFLKQTAGIGSLALVSPYLPSCSPSLDGKGKIALQLWTVRNEIEKDLTGTLRQVKSLGFDYVESAFFPESITLQQGAKAIKDAGLKVCSIHCEMEQGKWVELAETYECSMMIWHGWPENALYTTEEGIQQLADTYNTANAFAKKNGLSFGLHNHWWELTPHADGRLPLDILASSIDSDIFFEIDTYWAKVAGHNPATIIKKYADRTLCMHIKDGPATSPDDSMVAIGTGSQDFSAIIEASAGNAQWLVVEFDKCDTDIFEALGESMDYLKDKKLVD